MAKPGGTVARGYGAKHRRLRAQWQHVVDSGQAYCARCGGWIPPGSAWHLDHDDTRQAYLGASHAVCNRLDGARKGYAAQQRSYAMRGMTQAVAQSVRRQRW
jgi:hypothetical protein